MHREIGADYVLDLTMKSAAPRAELVARLRRTDAAAPLWEQTIGGDALVVEKMLLESLAHVLEGQALLRPLNPPNMPASRGFRPRVARRCSRTRKLAR